MICCSGQWWTEKQLGENEGNDKKNVWKETDQAQSARAVEYTDCISAE